MGTGALAEEDFFNSLGLNFSMSLGLVLMATSDRSSFFCCRARRAASGGLRSSATTAALVLLDFKLGEFAT